MPPRRRRTTVRSPLFPPGVICASDQKHQGHTILAPDVDPDLQAVHAWLMMQDLPRLLRDAVNDAIEYVLDGARTWRFDLNSPEVDSDERRTVGTKLQYRVLAALELEKEPPLDTTIVGTPVELKGTVRDNWMIPREGQCEICLLLQADIAGNRFRAYLMRPHRVWLNQPNQDAKRSIRRDAIDTYALPLVPWTDLPINPLRLLTEEQCRVVFAPRVGQATRLTALFGYLPEVVIPRSSILTVCANRQDPMRRARQIKDRVLDEHGLWVLCGKWTEDRVEAESRGYDLSNAAWVAVRP